MTEKAEKMNTDGWPFSFTRLLQHQLLPSTAACDSAETRTRTDTHRHTETHTDTYLC